MRHGFLFSVATASFCLGVIIALLTIGQSYTAVRNTLRFIARCEQGCLDRGFELGAVDLEGKCLCVHDEAGQQVRAHIDLTQPCE